MSHLDDFLDLYPNEGPDAGTGPLTRSRCTECSHELHAHSGRLDWCMVIVPIQMMRTDGGATRIERMYCGCRGFKK